MPELTIREFKSEKRGEVIFVSIREHGLESWYGIAWDWAKIETLTKASNDLQELLRQLRLGVGLVESALDRIERERRHE